MSYTNNIIEAPVGLADIVAALRENTADLGSLCQSKSINVWAKYKPVKNTEKEYESQLDTARTGWADTATWWKGYNGQCGIYLGTVVSGSDVTVSGGTVTTALAEHFKAAWTHDAPTGTGDYPWYRQEDFLKYKRNAVSPFGTLTSRPDPSKKYFQGGSTMEWVITPHTPEDGELAFSDLEGVFDYGEGYDGLATWHFGMLFVCVKDPTAASGYLGRMMIKTASEQIGSGGTTLTLTTEDTAEFADDIGTNETSWIAYPIIAPIGGTGGTGIVTEFSKANVGTVYLAPYKGAIVTASQPYVFKPSEFDFEINQARKFYRTLQFCWSINNKSAHTVRVAQLSDMTFSISYSTTSATANNHASYEGTWGEFNVATDCGQYRVIAITDETTGQVTTKSLTEGFTLEALHSATVTVQWSPADSNTTYDNIEALKIEGNVKYYKDGAVEYANGMTLYMDNFKSN